MNILTSIDALIFGEDSLVNISSIHSKEHIKNSLKYYFTEIDEFPYDCGFDYSNLKSELAYYFTGVNLYINYCKGLNRTIRHSFQAKYPGFFGTLTEKNGKAIIRGRIGYYHSPFVLQSLPIIAFFTIIIILLRETEQQFYFLIIFLLYLILLILDVIRSRKLIINIKKTLEMITGTFDPSNYH